MRPCAFLSPTIAVGGAPITLVQSKAGVNNFGGNTTTFTFTSDVTAGNLLVIPITWGGTAGRTIVSVTDTLLNTYTIRASSKAALTSTGNYSEIDTQIADCISASSGANVVLVTFSNTTDAIGIASGLELTAGTYDQSRSGTGTSTAPSAGALTTPSAGCFGIANVLSDDGAGSGGAFTKGSGWDNVLQNIGGGNYDCCVEYLAQSAAGSLTGDFTQPGSHPWVCSFATYKP